MNIKIGEQTVTFKITEKELRLLAIGQSLSLKTPISGLDFTSQIIPNSNKSGAKAPLSLNLENKRGLRLCANQTAIAQLIAMGKNKEGISVQENGLTLFLQVDLKSDNRPKPNHGSC